MKGMWNFVVVLGLAVTTCGGEASSGMQDEATGLEEFNGVYEFVQLDSPQGPNTGQQGMMIVQDGFLCHLRAGKNRETWSREDSEDMRRSRTVAAFGSTNATCGTFTLAQDRVVATWTASLDPNDEGNTSEFLYTLEGDTLTLAPSGAPQFKFVYRKVK